MMEQEMNSEKSSGYRPPSLHAYTGNLHSNDFASTRGEKITPSGRNLVPPLSERLLLGLISMVLWVVMIFLALSAPYLFFGGNVHVYVFVLFTMGLVTICLILINVVFWRSGWFWIRRRFQ